MVEHLFIAEKPSLAGEIAKTRAKQLGVEASKGQTCWTVGSDAVTWLFGHMYEQAPPDAYDARYKSWNMADLPIVPRVWRLQVSKDKAGHVSAINKLIKSARIIVNVGDAGREGQLLVDELIIESGRDAFGSDILRAWLQDMTDKGRMEAMGKLFPNAQKKPLYEAAVGRQRADWLLGLNMTRLYTGLARNSGLQDSVISIGRVQTPTLRLVVDRDREIEKFKPVDHYLPTGLFVHANGKFKASWIIPADADGTDSEGRLVDRKVADAVAARVAGKTGKVSGFDIKPKTKAPPLPFALSGLQKELSAKFGYTLEQSLQFAQALYETYKVTSYPRTDSSHLPVSLLKEEAPAILENLKGVSAYSGIVAKADTSLKSPAWNDSKISDHYAIVPTLEATPGKIAALPTAERQVFDIIAKRFLAQFYPDYRWDSLSATIEVGHDRFKASGNAVKDKGWKAVYEASGEQIDKAEDEDEDDQSLPRMARGDDVKVETAAIDAKRTSPPSRFTDGTLVEAMISIHKYVTDQEVKKRLRENSGIGTEATRAAILENLIRRKFIGRKGKFLISSGMGRDVVDIADDSVKDPALTAIWEERLEQVSEGKLTLDNFVGELSGEVRRLVETLRGTKVKISGVKQVQQLPGTGEKCPSCGVGDLVTRVVQSGDHKGKSYLSCDRRNQNDPDACKFAKWPDTDIPKLEGHGDTCPKCGNGKLITRMVHKGDHKGKRFLACDAYDSKNPAGSCDYTAWEKTKVDPLPGHGKKCPTCGVGELVTRVAQKGDNKGKPFLSCSAFDRDKPDSCKHFEWPEVAPLPGHGETCASCGKGKMVTRLIRNGDNKGNRFLACSEGKFGDKTSCQNAIWPESKGKARSGSPARPAGAKTGTAGLRRTTRSKG